MKEKIKILRTSMKLSQGEFAEKIGIPNTTISKYEHGEIKPSSEIISKIGSAFDVNLNWLLNGIGDKFLSKDVKTVEETQPDADSFVYVPLLNDVKASAGSGYIVDDESSARKMAFRKDWLNTRNISKNMLSAIHVTGESMIPTLLDGDIILIDRAQTRPIPDRIFVIRTEYGLVVKRVGEISESRIQLKSDNPAISQWALNLVDGANMLIGRVVWFGRSI
jgi:phage repressor protein C with HTH and peptisase S24 domain